MVRPIETENVSGFIHEPGHILKATGAGLALTHGAGANCEAPLLATVADTFAACGITVLRFNLAFRRKRRFGPPHPSGAAADRESIRAALAALRVEVAGPIYLGGHSYGGRQATMLAAEAPDQAAGLLLFSYPLHPPNKPKDLRTAHFPSLRTPALFVHGDGDPFGSPEELRAALGLIPAPTRVMVIERAGHDLRKGRIDPAAVVTALLETRRSAGSA
jgi:predicted alpha/beta-hydrolase family hydrolase